MKENLAPKIETSCPEAGEMKFFEKGKRPNYRYYYHGTFMMPLLVGKIKESGKFKFTEYKPNLTLSPVYGFSFARTEAEKDPERAKNRGRYLSREERRTLELDEKDSVLLVIEPTEEYNIHSTNEGMPNVFSTPDQIPDDKDPEFLEIFEDMKTALNQGGKVDLSKFKQRLMAYLKGGRGIVENKVENEEELAENMVMGELEHNIVRAIRTLYLDIERYKGKKFISLKDNREEPKPTKSKGREQLLEKIQRLRSIEPDNEVLRRYIEINAGRLEKELE